MPLDIHQLQELHESYLRLGGFLVDAVPDILAIAKERDEAIAVLEGIKCENPGCAEPFLCGNCLSIEAFLSRVKDGA